MPRTSQRRSLDILALILFSTEITSGVLGQDELEQSGLGQSRSSSLWLCLPKSYRLSVSAVFIGADLVSGPWIWSPLTCLLLMEEEIRQGYHNPKVSHYAKFTLCVQAVNGKLKKYKRQRHNSLYVFCFFHCAESAY